MFLIWIVSGLVLFPASLGRVLDSNDVREVRSSNVHSREHRGSNYMYKSSLRIRTDIPEKIQIRAGENKILECEAGGNPPPTIHWLKDGKRISQSMYEALHPEGEEPGGVVPILGLSFTRSRLFMDCITSRDAGEYTCVAENCAQGTCISKRKTTRLIVVDMEEGGSSAMCLAKKSYGSPARIHMWTHTRLEIQGSDVQLFCRPEGEPQPEIMWLGPNNTPLVEPEKYQVLENGDLIIRNINWEDMGGYTCVVKNPEGYDETLTFLYPTSSDDGKTTEG